VLDDGGLGTSSPPTVHDDETERCREPPEISVPDLVGTFGRHGSAIGYSPAIFERIWKCFSLAIWKFCAAFVFIGCWEKPSRLLKAELLAWAADRQRRLVSLLAGRQRDPAY